MKKQKILKPIEMSKLFGGKTVQTTGKSTTNSDGCTSTTTDSYENANNNNKLDCGESHTETVTIVCPK